MDMLAAFLAFLALSASGVPADHEIKSLPGWKGPLPSRMYSGFINVGTPPGFPNGTMYQHYWFVECEHDPKNAPVLVWYNGGPGASSLFGLLVELGPLLLNQDSITNDEYKRTGIPQPIYNPFAWTQVANILAIQNPPPIGFSYCDPIGPTGNGYSCGNWNDSLVAATNHRFLVNWMKEYSDFARNELYITGESYAGVYVPIIVDAIMRDPQGLNLVGMAVGDGCMGTDVLCGETSGPYYTVEFMHGHGQFSQALYRQIQEQCSETSLRTGRGITAGCQASLNQMTDEIGGYFAYNLYDDCTYLNDYYIAAGGSPSAVAGALNDYPCPGPASDIWLKRADVRTALHVPVNKNYFDGDNGVGFNYNLTERNVLPIYTKAIHEGLRVLVYNGDTDPGINSMVTQDKYVAYFAATGLAQTERWRPWTLDGRQRMGGYVMSYGNNFSYLTIRGSGHMVPEYKPEASLAALKAFLARTPYLPYVKPSGGK